MNIKRYLKQLAVSVVLMYVRLSYICALSRKPVLTEDDNHIGSDVNAIKFKI